MAREVKLTDPLPFLFYPDGERIFYLSPGPAVLLFAIEFKDIVRLNLISQQPVMQPTKHPFAKRDLDDFLNEGNNRHIYEAAMKRIEKRTHQTK